eukprot:6202807-Pleurochrysis_carterae.AAC.1
MARPSMPTAYATPGRVWVEQYRRAPTSNWYALRRSGVGGSKALLAMANSVSVGKSSKAGVWDGRTLDGTPSGNNVSTMWRI